MLLHRAGGLARWPAWLHPTQHRGAEWSAAHTSVGHQSGPELDASSQTAQLGRAMLCPHQPQDPATSHRMLEQPVWAVAGLSHVPGSIREVGLVHVGTLSYGSWP